MENIILNLSDYEREVKDLIKSKLFSSDNEYNRAIEETKKIKSYTKDIFVKE